MCVEDAFAGNSEVHLGACDDAMRFAAAHPQAARIIKISDITHSVINRVAISRRDLGIERSARIVEVRPRDNASGDRYFTDLSRRQFRYFVPITKWSVCDRDDCCLQAGKHTSDTNAGSWDCLLIRASEQ